MSEYGISSVTADAAIFAQIGIRGAWRNIRHGKSMAGPPTETVEEYDFDALEETLSSATPEMTPQTLARFCDALHTMQKLRDRKEKPATYEIRTIEKLIAKKGEPIFSERAVSVIIRDEAAGEYIVLKGEAGEVCIEPEQWPLIANAVDEIIQTLRD